MRQLVWIVCLGIALVAPASAQAQVTAASGWIYSSQEVSETTVSCLASAPGGFFVGVGPQDFSFPPTPATQRILFVNENGDERVVADGFNALGDCLYDPSRDMLFATDNGGDFAFGRSESSATGDTVYGIRRATRRTETRPASDFELLPSGSIPFAANVIFDGAGDLLISSPAGPNRGSVIRVEIEGRKATGASEFIDGLDYVGGLVVDSDGSILVADADAATFQTIIRRYDIDGDKVERVFGPKDTYGSFELGITPTGELIATGGGSPAAVVRDDRLVRPLVEGLGDPEAFSNSLSIDPVSGRVSFLASTFTGAEIDRSIHNLVRIKEMEAGGQGPEENECLLEFYGVHFREPKLNQRIDIAECHDGDPTCDADGVVNDACIFPVGFCVDVEDTRYRSCSPIDIIDLHLEEKKPLGHLAEAVGRARNALPITGPTCFHSDGIRIRLKVKRSGERRARSKVVRMDVRADPPKQRIDNDEFRMRCLPPLPPLVF